MRAILESYDSELAPTEYSPQLSRRLREAEDVLQKTQNHNAEMEVCVCAGLCTDAYIYTHIHTQITLAFIIFCFIFHIVKFILFKTKFEYLFTLVLAAGQFGVHVDE